MHLILLKVEDCPTTCYYFCCFTQISYRLNCKENHAHVKVCVIYAYIAVWCSLFVYHRGRRNMTLSGQRLLPIANPWRHMAREAGMTPSSPWHQSGTKQGQKCLDNFLLLYLYVFLCRSWFIKPDTLETLSQLCKSRGCHKKSLRNYLKLLFFTSKMSHVKV